MLEEAALNGGEVTALGRFDQMQAGRSEMRMDRPGVGDHASALDQAPFLERVDDAGYPAQAEPAPLGQIREAQVAPLGGGQASQDLKRAEGQTVLGLELGIQRSNQPLVRLQQTDPGIGMNV